MALLRNFVVQSVGLHCQQRSSMF